MNKVFKVYTAAIFLIVFSIGTAYAQTLKTPYGVLSVSSDYDLMLDQKKITPNINDGMSIDFKFSTKYGDKFAVLISLNSGGNACPATYRWVLLSERGFEASPEFGNCSEEAKGSLIGSDLIVQAPRYGTAPAAKYSFNGTQLKENNKTVNRKTLTGSYSMAQEKIMPLTQSNTPTNSATDSVVAWCSGFLNFYSTVTANQPMDRNHANVINRYFPRSADITKRLKSCVGNDSNSAKYTMCTKSLGLEDQEFHEISLFAYSKAKEAYAEGGITRLKANVELKCGRLY